MKQLKLIIASLLVLIAFGFTSCNQNNPSDALLFTGKYEGPATYAKIGDGVSPIVDAKVEITVLKIGDSYAFAFANKSIPTLEGIKMQKGDNTLVTLDNDEGGVIRITGKRLNIAYSNKKGTWTVINAIRK